MSRWPYSFTVGDLMERAEQLDRMHTMQEKIRRGVDQWAFLPRDLGARQEGLPPAAAARQAAPAPVVKSGALEVFHYVVNSRGDEAVITQ